MKQSVPRLHRIVSRKQPPRVVEPFKTRRQTASEKIAADLVSDANEIVEKWTNDLAGYVIVPWYFDGSHVLRYRLCNEGVIGPTLAPSYVHDILVRDVIVSAEVEYILNDE